VYNNYKKEPLYIREDQTISKVSPARKEKVGKMVKKAEVEIRPRVRQVNKDKII